MIAAERDQAALNRVWSSLILEELHRFGVEHICIAPGSRSTPLALEADEHSGFSLHRHFDERGLAFHALGIAKGSNKPVAIIVTSGTAVANLLPAVAEAALTGEKLVLLTADRPVELIDCGANQAISQTGIFSQHVTASLNLPSASEQISPRWLLTSVDQLLNEQHEKGGAVHINCPFPEPLYSDNGKDFYQSYLEPLQQWLESDKPYCQQLSGPFDSAIDIGAIEQKKGLIVIGSIELQSALSALKLGRQLGWPVLCDPQSGVSTNWAHYDIWLQNKLAQQQLGECEVILQFGARLVSKRLNQFIKNRVAADACKYYLINRDRKRLNPDHLAQTHIIAEPAEWAEFQTERLQGKISQYAGWADKLQHFSKHVSQTAVNGNEISEINLARQLSAMAGSNDLFIGNSLIVRLIDMVSALQGNRVYTNRGASGIDGLVATATGVQSVTQKPMLMMIGDTSLLYDLNSLSLCSRDIPMVVLVTNNDGGAIFNLLPVDKQKKQSLYQMPHGYKFRHAAKQFELEYLACEKLDELQGAVQKHLSQGNGTLVIEVSTNADEASADIKRLVKEIHAFS
ncbi:2-succinyl-5-enolpyruvyl-6-hydroxy-3-cyclohexene-1-carboxylic-acid synthase [Vibrio sp. SCSIO 43137]|uniref:2-succinyl-5-enolpyruvyl-6-hydroxy-3- cyclohexene-1-carboxylic-acid synthase n=1 Tax=Vibrio sp. SCSIO 43137 TaxID=3021011 RepID=UPI0023071545|nr:2-succinyl-5-enolpyruvyl-6-hydroxy-3-cyclohexene-1-carboxylic-acid synthase [Vibrio sp. SCSIO 43137]WCE30588.1 2-succinyl-5-enolpyruvyl-6-hydroxy-3-cyclohexene-1-carboxylic-acid synthase [Vibrio sp. SCSIO 43137]